MSDLRFHRQTLLPGIGESGQARLSQSSVLLLGCGALGSVAADMLARAGVGQLRIVDRDIVELTNLQRQVLYTEQDVAERMPKAVAARRRLSAINSSLEIDAIVDDINADNIEHLIHGVDVIVDGLDNFETRYLANDIAVKRGLPYVYGGAVGTTGMVLPILPRGGDWPDGMATPCFRCLFPEAPPPGATPTCDTAGVLGPAVSLIANVQVAEAIKLLTGNVHALRKTLLNVDLWSNEIVELGVPAADEHCPCCGQRRFDYLDGRAGSAAAVLCGRDAVQLRQKGEAGRIDLDAIRERLALHGRVEVNEFMLTAWLDDDGTNVELMLFDNGRALIRGTQDATIARQIFARFVGS